MDKRKITIVTPLKDEVANIDILMNSIESQSIPIECWLIVENDSIDGSKEKLESIQSVKNVHQFRVINTSVGDKQYKLGVKYSKIVNIGFKKIFDMYNINELDYIGILDADCFPEKDYYEKLINYMEDNQKIGIASGMIYYSTGKPHLVSKDYPRGSGRLWRAECLRDVGYYIGISADSISAIKARKAGWQVGVAENAKIVSRISGHKSGYQYFGESAYVRGMTFPYVFFRSVWFFVNLHFKYSLSYLYGYIYCYIKRIPKIDDKDILEYNKNRFKKKISTIINFKQNKKTR